MRIIAIVGSFAAGLSLVGSGTVSATAAENGGIGSQGDCISVRVAVTNETSQPMVLLESKVEIFDYHLGDRQIGWENAPQAIIAPHAIVNNPDRLWKMAMRDCGTDGLRGSSTYLAADGTKITFKAKQYYAGGNYVDCFVISKETVKPALKCTASIERGYHPWASFKISTIRGGGGA